MILSYTNPLLLLLLTPSLSQAGLKYICRNWVHSHCVSLKLRMSQLHAGNIGCVVEGLGHGSGVEHLDLSDNRLGMSASSIPTSSGTEILMHALSCTLNIRVLKLARNALRDEEMQFIAVGVRSLPTLEVLDLHGNYCHDIGMEYLCEALLSHGAFALGEIMGLKDLNLSQNPIGNTGLKLLSEALDRNHCLIALKLSECDVTNEGMERFLKTLQGNVSILWLDVTKNDARIVLTAETNAEAEANRLLKDVQIDAMSVNTGELSKPVYIALKNKIHTLPEKTGFALHDNPSFNVPLSVMKEALHSAFIPSRRSIYTETVGRNALFKQRLLDSKALENKMFCARVIARHVMRWYIKIRERNRIKEAMRLARLEQMKEDEFDLGL